MGGALPPILWFILIFGFWPTSQLNQPIVIPLYFVKMTAFFSITFLLRNGERLDFLSDTNAHLASWHWGLWPSQTRREILEGLDF